MTNAACKLVNLLLILLFLMMLTGCWHSEAIELQSPIQINEEKNVTDGITPNNKTRIGATFLGDFEFINTLKRYIEIEAKNQNIDLLVYEGKSNSKTQLDNVMDMIENQVDVIILNPADATGAAKAVQKAVEAEIPVVGINALADTDLLTTYIGSNDIESGEIVMQFIAEKLNGYGNIVILQGLPEQSSQIQRTQGIKNMLEKYPNIRVLDQKSGKWSRQEAYQLMKSWYEEYGESIDGVVSHNDAMALGALAYLKEIGKQKKIPVIGIDAIQEALISVKNGDLAATVFQDAKGQAKLAIEVSKIITQNGSVAKSYFIPYKLVTQENVHYYFNY